MKIAFLEGKSSTERNKMIAAAVLGLVALVTLYMAFGRSLFGGSSTTASVKVTATPKPGAPPVATSKPDLALPTAQDQAFLYETTPVVYMPGRSYAPDPGRNIFAFYEPPPPCNPNKPGDCPPSPTPTPVYVPPPTPAPTPPIFIAGLNPSNLFAGIPGFKLQVSGNNFTPDSRIYFNQNELPTAFISNQALAADIPANFVTQEGPRQIMVRTPDGTLYSNPMMLTVMAPPKPTFLYIGMIGRKRYNNDTAYFTDKSQPTPFGHRLNDVIGGRFRLVDISPVEVVVEDTTLGRRTSIPISKDPGAGSGTGQPPRGFPSTSDGFVPFNPANVPSEIPGIPGNIPRYTPPQPQTQPQQRPAPAQKPDPKEKKDVDDDGDE